MKVLTDEKRNPPYSMEISSFSRRSDNIMVKRKKDKKTKKDLQKITLNTKHYFLRPF
jgi:hypothetical protein